MSARSLLCNERSSSFTGVSRNEKSKFLVRMIAQKSLKYVISSGDDVVSENFGGEFRAFPTTALVPIQSLPPSSHPLFLVSTGI